MDAEKIRYRARVTVTLNMLLTSPSMEDASREARGLVTGRPGFRNSTINALHVSPLSLAESLRHDNLALWQESEALSLGTDEQRLRWGTDALPDEELLALARPVLFSEFTGFRKYNRMPVSAIAHPRGEHGVWTCVEGHGRNLPITWSTLPEPVLTALEWESLRRLDVAIASTNRHPWLASAPAGATVETRIHKGTCGACKRSAAETCALVTIAWAGRTLSREYRL